MNIMDALKKAYDKWQCIEQNDNDIGMLMFSKGDLLSFALYYHQSQVNNVVLDGVNHDEQLPTSTSFIKCTKCGIEYNTRFMSKCLCG
jgi:hypothetical protein